MPGQGRPGPTAATPSLLGGHGPMDVVPASYPPCPCSSSAPRASAHLALALSLLPEGPLQRTQWPTFASPGPASPKAPLPPGRPADTHMGPAGACDTVARDLLPLVLPLESWCPDQCGDSFFIRDPLLQVEFNQVQHLCRHRQGRGCEGSQRQRWGWGGGLESSFPPSTGLAESWRGGKGKQGVCGLRASTPPPSPLVPGRAPLQGKSRGLCPAPGKGPLIPVDGKELGLESPRASCPD